MTPHERLIRAQHTLDRIQAEYDRGRADPWRLAEARLRYDEALAAALDAEPSLDDDGGPRARVGRGGR